MGEHLDGTSRNFDDLFGARDQGPPFIAPTRGRGATNGARVEEAVVPPIGMGRGVVDGAIPGVLEVDPLDGGVLGADVEGVVLVAVGDGKDVADVVGAVDLVEAGQGRRAPGVDDGVAGAGEEHGAVGGEKEAEDAAFVGLDLADLLEGGERPDDNLAIVGACVDRLCAVADGEAKDGAVVSQAVDEVGSGLGAVLGVGEVGSHKGRNHVVVVVFAVDIFAIVVFASIDVQVGVGLGVRVGLVAAGATRMGAILESNEIGAGAF